MSITSEVCFVVESKEFRIKGDKLARTSQYYAELLENSKDFSEIRLLLPDWISIRPFQIYLSYIESSRIPKLDLIMAQKLLWLSDFFKDLSLQETLITTHIIPYLNKETVLLFVQDACTKIQSNEEFCETWNDLFDDSCLFAAKNFKYLFEKFSNAINKLEKLALKRIFEKTVDLEEFDLVVEKMIEQRQLNGIIELISSLESESLKDFSSGKNLVFEWNIEDFEFGNFYKESEPFKIGVSQWVLCVWCFEHEQRLEISIKQAEIQSENKHRISVVTAIIQVQDDILESLMPQSFPIPTYSKNQCSLREINAFHPESIRNFSIKLYAQSEVIISKILEKITMNPMVLATDDIGAMPKKIFTTLLGLKYLNVTDEDFALEALAKWVQLSHCELTEPDLEALSDSIFWNFTTVKKLVSVIFTYPKFKQHKVFVDAVRKELDSKSKKLNNNSERRKSYKKDAIRENYANHREYLTTLFNILLTFPPVESDTVSILQQRLSRAEEEISMLKNMRKDALSPIPQIKVLEEDISINLTPAHLDKFNLKSRNLSTDTYINKSVDISTKLKSRRAGVALNDLISRIRSTKKPQNGYSKN